MATAISPSTFVAANRHVGSPTLLNLLIVDDDRFVREAAPAVCQCRNHSMQCAGRIPKGASISLRLSLC